MMRLLAWTLASLLLATAAFAQPPRTVPPRERPAQREAPRGTAVIRGMVIAADSGTPIRRAQVRVSGQGTGNRLATTDAQGRFEVRDLPAGRFSLSAAKGGFVPLQYGQKRPTEAGTPLQIADGQVMDKLVIALPRGAVISGRITDEFGEPVANAVVNAMRYGFAAGARRLLPGSGQNSRDTTDDHGQFRLFGLSPGEYVVSASFRSGAEALDPTGETTGYAATYYPGTTSIADAQRVIVGVGQEQGNLTFALVATRLVRVSGAALNSQGTPLVEGVVSLTSSNGRAIVAGPSTTFSGRTDHAGQFRIMNVPPGRYLALAGTARGRGDSAVIREAGRQEITVGTQDLDGLVLVTAPSARITGVVVSDRASTSTLQPQDVSISTRPAEVESLPTPNSNVRVSADWTFELTNIFEPRSLRVSTPPGWTLKSVTVNGKDVTDAPIDISPGQTVTNVQVLLTDRVTEINGRLADTRNAAITDATVIIFPADENKWMFQSRFIRGTRPDQDGRFTIRGLPAHDDYLAVAVQGLEDGQAGDPEFLATVRDRATAFTLREGETRTLDLRMP